MRRRSIIPLIERAVLIAASSCGTTSSQPDAGSDAGAIDASNDATLADAATDAIDAGDEFDDDVPFVNPYPLPDGCAVWGKPDAFAPCGYGEHINNADFCGVQTDADIQPFNVCFTLCDPTEPDCIYYDFGTDDAGDADIIITCGAGCVGRLHESARDCCEHVIGSIGDFLARAAALEAASIDSFHIVAADLARFGAPASLRRDAMSAARDEERHARIVGALATELGAQLVTPPPPCERAHDMLGFAIENAIEGCVRETYGAAVAMWQTTNAKDARVRDAMREIAADEARHADLGWRIDAWLASSQHASARKATLAAREAAIRDLERSIDAMANTFDAVLGLPNRDGARAIVAALRSTVWSPVGLS